MFQYTAGVFTFTLNDHFTDSSTAVIFTCEMELRSSSWFLLVVSFQLCRRMYSRSSFCHIQPSEKHVCMHLWKEVIRLEVYSSDGSDDSKAVLNWEQFSIPSLVFRDHHFRFLFGCLYYASTPSVAVARGISPFYTACSKPEYCAIMPPHHSVYKEWGGGGIVSPVSREWR